LAVFGLSIVGEVLVQVNVPLSLTDDWAFAGWNVYFYR